MKKFLVAIAAAFVLCVPAFASDLYFADSGSYVTIYDDPYEFSIINGVGYFYGQWESNGTDLDIYAISDSSSSSYRYGKVDGYHNDYYITGSFGDYFNRLVAINSTTVDFVPQISYFSASATDAEIQAAFADFLANPPSPTPIIPTSFEIPRGNVAYFQVASNSDVNFVSQFAENSGLLSSGNVYGPWGDTYQRISAEASLPGPGIEFPRSGSDAIVWGKGEPLNVLGQTKVGVFTKSCSAGTYYAFYNPAYQSISGSDGFGSTSVGSNVTVSGNFSFIRIYSLQQLLDISTSTDNYDTYYVGTPDGDGGVTWVDQDDQVNYPSSGGENQDDEPISSVSLIESIKRILRNILSEIESIFTFGFSAIRDLVDLMDEFVATFDDLYEWLPEECYTLLIACVSVAIVIGVFKVFL